MEFATFCNICFCTENDIEEDGNAAYILISFFGSREMIKKSKFYLCRSCCEKLVAYDHFRNMCATNVLLFRYSYFQLKRKLEIGNDPDMKEKLKNFVNTKVCNKVDISMSDSKMNHLKYEDDSEEYELHCKTELESVESFETPIDYSSSQQGDVINVNLGNEDEDKPSQMQKNNENNALPNLFDFPRRQSVPTAEKPYACDECDKTFTELRGLRKHQRNHAPVKPHRCNICEKSFTELSRLRLHIRTHTGEKPYTCNVCEKAFTQMGNLMAHQRVHTGEKPHTCNVCDRSFSKLSNLKEHQQLHTGDRPYTCSLCDKAFTNLSNLRKHHRVHTGEKPYICSVCQKAFNKLNNLKQHERIHSGVKPFSCELCDKAFIDLHRLQKHQRVHWKQTSSEAST